MHLLMQSIYHLASSDFINNFEEYNNIAWTFLNHHSDLLAPSYIKELATSYLIFCVSSIDLIPSRPQLTMIPLEGYTDSNMAGYLYDKSLQ